MAVLNIYNPLTFEGGLGTVSFVNSTLITITAGNIRENYYGTGFTFSGSSVTGGTVTDINLENISGGSGTYYYYGISGVNRDASTIANLLLSGDTEAFRFYIFSGNDTLNGHATADDYLDGYGGNNLVNGYGGNDSLFGGIGTSDSLVGGTGDDDYYISSEFGAVSIYELPGGGIDAVIIQAGSHTLQDHLEILSLEGSAANGSGNSADNLILGNGLANLLEGGAGNDTLLGGLGNDTLDGGSGNDVMEGGAFDNIYIVDSLLDVISDVTGTDTVIANVNGYALAADVEILLLGASIISGAGNAFANTLTGNDLDNVLDGAGGNDTLSGGSGSDTLHGGAGDDVYEIDADDVLVEVADGGIDVVRSSATHVLGAEIENLILIGAEAIDGTGNALANVITGNGAANVLDGGAGADTLNGGLGNDTYYVDDAGDVVVDSGGTDTLALTGSYDLANAPTIENVTLAGLADINATGNTLNNVITGNDGRNVLTAVGGGDRLFGMGGMDTLIGSSSGETTDGGGGADSMAGGFGFDTYYVDDAGDVVVEVLVNDSGYLDRAFSSVSYVLPQYVEILTLTGDAAINGGGKGSITGNGAANYLTGSSSHSDELYGMDGNDTLDGGAGSDKMFGGAGDDLYFIDDFDEVVHPAFLGELEGEGNDTAASAFNNTTLPTNFEALVMLPGMTTGVGNSLDNLIIGHAAYNVLDGGAGADTMIGGEGDDDYRVDNAGDMIVELDDEGHDKVQSSVSFSIAGTAVEELWLSLADHLAAIDATGNALDNYLRGTGGNNSLSGGGGNDTLDGFSGLDTFTGGAGDDYYIVNHSDSVIHESAGGGTDLVFSHVSFSIEFLPELEHLSAHHAAMANLTGNGLANRIIGSSDHNLLDARGGSDTVYGYFGNDTLLGGDGDDWLDAGSGNDIMTGGTGNDRYVVDNFDDTVDEQAGEGMDVVESSVSYTLGANLEALLLKSPGIVNGTGNALDNILSGGSGNNQLDGGGGADISAGGLGNDVYIVDNSGDLVMELANSGIDEVRSGVSYDLMQVWHVENLTLTGGDPVNGSGNWLDNFMTGNDAANLLDGNRGGDILIGRGGNDTLIGGLGDDWLVWDAADGSVQGGAGADTLQLSGSGMVLDLTVIADTLITDMEIIDLTGNGNNTLTLALADVLAISSTTDLLTVDGNTGDTLNLQGGWVNGGGAGYTSYTQGLATLLVDSDLSVVFA